MIFVHIPLKAKQFVYKARLSINIGTYHTGILKHYSRK